MFYDLTKDGTLSPKELFKHRLKKNVTIPSRGGQKDFEPDGSWMQKKSLEVFLKEKASALAEPRVEKLKSLVEGEWKEEKRLVDLKKAGKFWMHMGFTDNRRNWLYPEEAIFLIETNALEVYHQGLPMSIQEAFNKMLGQDVSVEEYQVFSHLRRLGYVVLRHEEGQVLTDYERQINLERPTKKKGKKWKKDLMNNTPSTSHQNESDTSEHVQDINPQMQEDSIASDSQENQDLKPEACETGMFGESDKKPVDSIKYATDEKETVTESMSNQSNIVQDSSSQPLSNNDAHPIKRSSTREDCDPTETHSAEKKQKTDYGNSQNGQTEESANSGARTNSFDDDPLWSSCFIERNTLSEEEVPICLKQTVIDTTIWDLFPDIANKEALVLHFPELTFIPSHIDINENIVHFDVNTYRQKNSRDQNERPWQSQNRKMLFSFAEWNDRKAKPNADNWEDFKRKTAERNSTISSRSPMEHLWKGSVTPLIESKAGMSCDEVLEKLRIIQCVNNDVLLKGSKPMSMKSTVKVSYDVHLPDRKFRKSMPGIPNHRVCVTRLTDDPPSLAHFMNVSKKYKDKVPLHWAVVDSGEIAFYIFDHSSVIETITE